MDFINSKFVSAWLTIFAYVIKKTKTELDDIIIAKLAEKLQEIADQKPKRQDVVNAVIDIFEWLADLTKTPVDDLIVGSVKAMFGGEFALVEEVKVRHFVKLIFQMGKARREARRARRKSNKDSK